MSEDALRFRVTSSGSIERECRDDEQSTDELFVIMTVCRHGLCYERFGLKRV